MKTIITDKKGNEYVFHQDFEGNDTHYLIPYIDLPGRSKKYWQGIFIPRDTWVMIIADRDWETHIHYPFCL